MRTISLSNRVAKFEFDRRTGSLVQIEDLCGGVKHLKDATRSRLFRVMCPDPLWDSRFSDSQDADAPDDTHEAAIEWFAKAGDMVRKYDPQSYVIGEHALPAGWLIGFSRQTFAGRQNRIGI